MKDYRTTEEVEQSRCIRPRQQWKRCPCGKQPGKECSSNPNMRVARIVKAVDRGQIATSFRHAPAIAAE
jgi:hypothetical protein